MGFTRSTGFVRTRVTGFPRPGTFVRSYSSVPDVPYLTGWTYRQRVILGNDGGPALTNYQIPIDLNANNFDFSQAKSDGSDLRITSADGETVLTTYTEFFNLAGLAARIWVKVPSVSAGANTTLFAYAGNSGASTVSSFNSTFQKQVVGTDTLALYHCDNGSGTSLTEASGGTAGVIAGGTWSAGAGGGWGWFGQANGFSSGNTITLDGTTSSIQVTGLLDTPPIEGGIRLWFKYPIAPVANSVIFSKVTSLGDGVVCYTDGSVVLVKIMRDGGTTSTIATGHQLIVPGQWHCIAVTWGDILRLFMDGRLDDDAGGSGFEASGNVWPIAGSTPNTFTVGALNTGSLSARAAIAVTEIEVLQRQITPAEQRRIIYRCNYTEGCEECDKFWTGTNVDVLNPTTGFEADLIQECSVIRTGTNSYVGGYTGVASSVVKLGQFTSTDGLTLVRDVNNPIVDSGNQSFKMIGLDGIHRWYSSDGYVGATNIHMMTSVDGVTWPYDNVSDMPIVVSSGQAGIIPVTLDNMAVWQTDATHWHMYTEGSNNIGLTTIYDIYYLTSVDGVTWTPHPAGALTNLKHWPDGSASGPSRPYFDGSQYHFYIHTSCRYFGPSSISHIRGTDFINMTLLGNADNVLMLKDEVTPNGVCDQRADPDLLVLGTPEVRIYNELVRNPIGTPSEGRLQASRYMGSMDQLQTTFPAVAVAASTPPTLWTPASLGSHLKVWTDATLSDLFLDTGKYKYSTGRFDKIAVAAGLLGTPDLTATVLTHDGFRVGVDSQGRTYMRLGGSLSGFPSDIPTAMTYGDLSALFPSACTIACALRLDGSSTASELFAAKPAIDSFFQFAGSGYFGWMRNARINAYPAVMPTSGYLVVVVESDGANYTVYLNGVSQGAQSADYFAGSSFILGSGQYTSVGVQQPAHLDLFSWVMTDRVNAGDTTNLTTYMGSRVGLVL